MSTSNPEVVRDTRGYSCLRWENDSFSPPNLTCDELGAVGSEALGGGSSQMETLWGQIPAQVVSSLWKAGPDHPWACPHSHVQGHITSRGRIEWARVFFVVVNKFIYFWLRWVFAAARGLSQVSESGGYASLRCAGFSSRCLLLLQSTGSRCVGFSSCGMWAQ